MEGGGYFGEVSTRVVPTIDAEVGGCFARVVIKGLLLVRSPIRRVFVYLLVGVSDGVRFF